MPSVSVIIPAYNAAAFIKEALHSAESQTYPIHEIIVVDDGSTDGTAECVRRYGSPKVQLICRANGGSASARNAGIRAASGELVAFLDADDLWAPEKTAKQVERLEETQVSLVYCGKTWIGENGQVLPNRDPQISYPEGDVLPDLIRGNYITSTSCVLVRRERLMGTGGFDEAEDVKGAEDHELWLRMALEHRMAAVPEELVLYRRHEGNITNNRPKYYTSAVQALDRIRGRLSTRGDGRKLRSVLHNRIRELLAGAVAEMFYAGNYRMQRKFILLALRRRAVSWREAHLLLLGMTPVALIELLRRAKVALGVRSLMLCVVLDGLSVRKSAGVIEMIEQRHVCSLGLAWLEPVLLRV